MTNQERKALWAVAALEGASVMVLESMCAKYLAPVYGETLQVWSSAVGMTLVGLAIGYFAGSYFASRRKGMIWWTLLAASILMALTPSLAQWIIPKLISGDLLRDSLAVSAVLLLPTLSIVGMTPGLVVAGLSAEGNPGQVAGRVFALSTLGSILSIFLTGFFIVPAIGVVLPLICTSAMLALVPMLVLLRRRQWLAFLPLGALAFAFWNHNSHSFPENASLKMHYYSEGILGQVLVGDFDYRSPEGNQRKGRALYVNRMPQTMIDLQTGDAIFSPYIDFMDFATSPVGKGDVLLLGLGGGNLVRRFRAQGRTVDVCELDERVVHASRTYFHRDADDAGTHYYIDDARHFLRTAPRKYDLIVFDIFKGESPPHHAFTEEAFADAAKILKPNGFLLINFLGRPSGPRSLGPRAVTRTLQAANFGLRVVAIPNIDNVIVMAAPKMTPPIDSRLQQFELPLTALDLRKVPVLRDDTPMLELLHAETAAWNRAWYNENYTVRFMKERIPLFR